MNMFDIFMNFIEDFIYIYIQSSFMSVKKINGYRILLNNKLGKGSYGHVYGGEQDGTKQQCAIKIIDKSNINSDPYLKAALISEIKIMKSVRSENIVGFYDVMESSNNYYIIQELCDGGDLEHYLKKQPNKCVNEKQAIRILTETCNGFISLVKEGIVHRDLKPANILIGNNKMKIGDFGFAKKNKGGLKNQTAVGTPLYMSVELLKGEPYTSKCDIWAIGFIYYEILHGKTPWTARSQFELVKNIQNKPLQISQNLSKQSVDFLRKTLKTSEEQRIGWDQLFRHPIFSNAFNNQIKNTESLENTFKKIMSDIRFQVNSNNINLMKMWTNLGYSSDKQLNQKQFKQFLKYLLPNMAHIEQEYFYHKMDINKDGTISLKQIQFQFKKNDIPLTSQFEDKFPFLLKRIVTVEEDLDEFHDKMKDSGSNELQKKIKHCFTKMDHILNKRNATLYKVFTAYDRDESGELSLQQFGKIMKKLDPSFADQEIEVIFDLVDTDKSKTIDFDELNSYYCKINGIPEALSLPPEYISQKFKRTNPYHQEKSKQDKK